MDNMISLLLLDTQTTLLIFLIALIIFVVLVAILGTVFILVLRKRRPVIKVIMNPLNNPSEEQAKPQAAAQEHKAVTQAQPAAVEPQPVVVPAVIEEEQPEEVPEEVPEVVEEEQPEEVPGEVPAVVEEEQPEEVPEEVPAVVEEEQPEEVTEEVPEVVEEEQLEKVTEEVPEVVEEDNPEEAPEDDNAQVIAAYEGGNVQESESGAIVRGEDGTAIYFMYNKSFTAKLIQARDEVREYYNTLKNYCLSYKKVTTRISWSHENVKNGRNKICRFVLRGKSLYLYLPLNPDDYAETKYKVERSEAKRFEELPCLYRIKNPRRVKYATELIDAVMEKYGLKFVEKESEDFVKDYPYEETLPLIKRGLIKVTRSNKKIEFEDLPDEPIVPMFSIEPRAEVKVQEVKELMADDVAEALVIHSARKADTTKKGIVNIDVLSECFKDGEKVTLEEIKKRVAGFDKKITYVKVLARGTLNKKLIVEADMFSVDAEKMILLTGGQVIKTQA
ncbi:MAG: uL15 family ribosomal protein [Clostridiales bacterium]|nr:uL15 family ribosomal protein [Clostridiales bacterium]